MPPAASSAPGDVVFEEDIRSARRRRDRGATAAIGTLAISSGRAAPPVPLRRAVNIGWSRAWSRARICSLPFGPAKLQPSRDLAMAVVSVALPDAIACTIIWAAVKPSGLNRSGCRLPW